MKQIKCKTMKLVVHTTSGGAVYLTNSHDFRVANIVIRMDGKHPELIRCTPSFKQLRGDES